MYTYCGGIEICIHYYGGIGIGRYFKPSTRGSSQAGWFVTESGMPKDISVND